MTTNNKNQLISEQRKTPIRAFASFLNREHQEMMWNELLDVMPKKHAHRLWLYMGMMDSTIAEGYSDDNK